MSYPYFKPVLLALAAASLLLPLAAGERGLKSFFRAFKTKPVKAEDEENRDPLFPRVENVIEKEKERIKIYKHGMGEFSAAELDALRSSGNRTASLMAETAMPVLQPPPPLEKTAITFPPRQAGETASACKRATGGEPQAAGEEARAVEVTGDGRILVCGKEVGIEGLAQVLAQNGFPCNEPVNLHTAGGAITPMAMEIISALNGCGYGDVMLLPSKKIE